MKAYRVVYRSKAGHPYVRMVAGEDALEAMNQAYEQLEEYPKGYDVEELRFQAELSARAARTFRRKEKQEA